MVRVLDRLKDIGKDIGWLSSRLTVSEETVRAWVAGEQPIPDNKQSILEAFAPKQDETCESPTNPNISRMHPARDIINSN